MASFRPQSARARSATRKGGERALRKQNNESDQRFRYAAGRVPAFRIRSGRLDRRAALLIGADEEHENLAGAHDRQPPIILIGTTLQGFVVGVPGNLESARVELRVAADDVATWARISLPSAFRSTLPESSLRSDVHFTGRPTRRAAQATSGCSGKIAPAGPKISADVADD